MEANSASAPPGRTAILIYTFHEPSTLLYGGHGSGHYAAGRRGTITIQP